MNRALLTTSVLVLASALAWPQNPPPSDLGPRAVTPPPPSASAAQVPHDAPVVTVHGVCPPGKTAGNSDSCTTVITKDEFNAMLAVMNISNQAYSQAALKGIAESYVQLMALAEAGQKAGIDKEPRFEEMMKIARVRALAESYRRSLDEKFSNPPPAEVETFYKENAARYEQLKVDRVFIPLADPKHPQERVAFEKKAHPLANQLRERAAKGEDMNTLQAEAYKTLGIGTPPPSDLGAKRKGAFSPNFEKDIFALKPGEVTKVEIDLSGFSFFKVRSREPIPLEYVKPEITRELYQKNMEAAVKAATGSVHSELNEEFFKPAPATKGPPVFRPAPHVVVKPGESDTTPNQPPSNTTPPK